MSKHSSEYVTLHHTSQIPASHDGKKQAVIILHGFFGSKRNWGSLSKALMQRLNRPIYALDLRNHGSSPHAEPMNYEAMADDVWHFVDTHKLSDISVIGHSMGGKVAMAMGLRSGYERPVDLIKNLIVIDVSPIKGRISKEFTQYVDTLKEIESLQLTSRKEATEYLERMEKDPAVRAFLLTNLLPFHKESPRARFMVPLDTFKTAIPAIGDFPYEPGERSWNGRTLFVKGSRSPYIKASHVEPIKQFFPQAQIEELDTGHWVHAEKPGEFMEIVCKFIGEN